MSRVSSSITPAISACRTVEAPPAMSTPSSPAAWHAAESAHVSAAVPLTTATVPEDFQQALDANPSAAEFFATLKGANRYAFLYRLHHVKKPDARAKRIAMYIEILGEGKTFH